MRTDRQTDGWMDMMELKVVLRNFANAPKRILAILSQILRSNPFEILFMRRRLLFYVM